MRIAFMTNNYKPMLGGVPISIERLAKELRSQGHEVTIFAPTYENQEPEEGVFRYRTLWKSFLGGTVLPDPFDRQIAGEFERRRREGRPFDVIHVHHPVLIGQTAVSLSRRFHLPVVFTYHTRYEQYLSYFKPIRLLENRRGLSERLLCQIQDVWTVKALRLFLNRCDMVLAPTKGMEDYLERECQVPPEKLEVLPTGLPKSQYRSVPLEKKKLRERFLGENVRSGTLFLTVSRISHEKNVEFLLRSVAQLKEMTEEEKAFVETREPCADALTTAGELQRSGCTDFRLVVAGDGPELAGCRRLAEELGISGEVLFTGSIPNEELTAYYQAADAFVFASKTETQGIVILEAMAGRLPVLAVEASGVSDLVTDSVNGYLCRENMEDFAKMLAKFLHLSPEKREILSNFAWKTANQYREEAVARIAVSIYNKAILRYHGSQTDEKTECEERWTTANTTFF